MRAQCFLITFFIFAIPLGLAQSDGVPSEDAQPSSPKKDIYVYLDYSMTIVNKDPDRPSIKLAAMLREALSLDSGLVIGEDRIHISTFGKSLSADTESLASDNAWSQAIGSFESSEEGDKETRLADVIESIHSIAASPDAKKDKIKVFIVASDFVHDPENDLSNKEGQARLEIANAITRLASDNGELFKGKDARCFLFLLKVEPSAKTQNYKRLITSMAEDSIRDLRTKLDAIVSVDGIGGRELAAKIRSRLLRWVQLAVIGYESNGTTFPNIVIKVTNPNWGQVVLEDFGVSLNPEGQVHYPGFFKEEPQTIVFTEEITLKTKDLEPDYKKDRLYLIPKPVEIPLGEPERLEIMNVPEDRMTVESMKPIHVFGFDKSLLEIHPDVWVTGVEADETFLDFYLYRKGKAEPTEFHLNGGESFRLVPFAGRVSFTEPLLYMDDFEDSKPEEYRIRVEHKLGGTTMTKDVPLLDPTSKWQRIIFRSKVSIPIVFLICLCLLAFVPTVANISPWVKPVRGFKDKLIIVGFILASACLLLSAFMPISFAWAFSLFPAYAFGCIVFKLMVMRFPRRLDEFSEDEKEEPVEKFITRKIGNAFFFASLLSGLVLYFLIKMVLT